MPLSFCARYVGGGVYLFVGGALRELFLETGNLLNELSNLRILLT